MRIILSIILLGLFSSFVFFTNPVYGGNWPNKSTMDSGVFDQFHDVLVWTDKDHYNFGETVKVFGKFSPNFYTNNNAEKNKVLDISIAMHQGNHNPPLHRIQVNSDGTFSTSFILSETDFYQGDLNSKPSSDLPSRFSIFFEYCKYEIDTCDTRIHGNYPASWEFTSGDYSKLTDYQSLILQIDDSAPYTPLLKLVQNGKDITNISSLYDQSVIRITTPSGLVLPGMYQNGINSGIYSIFQRTGFGTYQVQLTAGDYVSKVIYDYKRAFSNQISDLTVPHVSVIKTIPLQVSFNIILPDPEQPIFSYKILDPNGKTLISDKDQLRAGDRNTSFQPFYNSAFQGLGDLSVDTSNFPNVDGNYTVVINYEGTEKSTTFSFVSFSKDYELNKIHTEISNMFQYVDFDHLKSLIDNNKTSSTDVQTLVNQMIQEQNIKANSTLHGYENEIKNWPTSLDSKADAIYDLRHFMTSVVNQQTAQIQGELNQLEQYKAAKIAQEQQKILQEQEKKQQELEQMKVNQQIQNEKEKIKQEILSNNNTQNIPSHNVPTWIKNTAKGWHDGTIGDEDFEKGIGYLIKQKIITVNQTMSNPKSGQHVPSWTKKLAGMWNDGSVSDDDFLKGIEYLVKVGIIRIDH